MNHFEVSSSWNMQNCRFLLFQRLERFKSRILRFPAPGRVQIKDFAFSSGWKAENWRLDVFQHLATRKNTFQGKMK
ncbi:hypothetical protein B5F77_00130 [Parabacteroides sp. An277]|nr:hypothetical protein B5F77_00130 [Parabacteroides sp. An277]